MLMTYGYESQDRHKGLLAVVGVDVIARRRRGGGRGLPKMKVPTRLIWKTSTCLIGDAIDGLGCPPDSRKSPNSGALSVAMKKSSLV